MISNGSPRSAMVCAAATRRSLPNASRLARAVARRVAFCVSREAGGLDIHHRHTALSDTRSSSPVKAGDPVFRGICDRTGKPRRTGYSAFAEYDGLGGG